MTTLGYINGNNPGTGNHHMILDNLQVVSAASAGSGTLPVAVSGNLAGLAPNTTYYYRTPAGVRGSTTNVGSIPVGSVIERIVTS
jgi:phosphodiesterase/alkaline phosphatase D-like protein